LRITRYQLLMTVVILGGLILVFRPIHALTQAPNFFAYLPISADNSVKPAPTVTQTPAATQTSTATVTPTATQTPGVSQTPGAGQTPTATQTSSGNPTPVGQSGNWKLIFDDEFNGTTLDTSVWGTCYPWLSQNRCNLSGTNELELYQPQGVYLDGAGHLVLRAQKQTVGGYDYTSGMVTSYPGLNFKYGYIEARIKVPAGNGLWPAFWMMPSDYSWPPEIDIVEILGREPTKAYFTYHWGRSNNDSQYIYSGPNFSAGWHVFAVKWEAGVLTWYTDGIQRGKFTDSVITSKSMYILLSLAVGGDWPGVPDSTTPFPSIYQIDYVRVWQ
jgi:beta-glucanase (GH16 family)